MGLGPLEWEVEVEGHSNVVSGVLRLKHCLGMLQT